MSGNLDEEDAESVNSTSLTVLAEVDVAGKSNLNMMGITNIFDVNDDAFQKVLDNYEGEGVGTRNRTKCCILQR